ncbi:hypothetical protein HPP92_028417 [Vanilla planifolia]|uniref:Protein TIC 214 n=1 Tax=Vanilla planifolia TaxID=51239 RepID=A0A835P7Z4_VANPL|nr:hypothetical protein HPP92_028417 [Vanilla planifolia]
MKNLLFRTWNPLLRTWNLLFRNLMRRKSEWKISDLENEETKERRVKEKKDARQIEAEEQIAVIEAWESFQYVRAFLLLIQSFFRKYILLPSFIITKNLFRILLFQWPEWFEDWEQWKREIHLKCAYTGVPSSENEFPRIGS